MTEIGTRTSFVGILRDVQGEIVCPFRDPDRLVETVADAVAPGIVDQEEQPVGETLLDVHLQGVIGNFPTAQDGVEASPRVEGCSGRIAPEVHRKAGRVGIQIPTLALQLGRPGPGIGDGGQHVTRQFLLYVQVPLLNEALFEVGIHDNKAAPECGHIRRGLGREAIGQREGASEARGRDPIVRVKEGGREGWVHVQPLHPSLR